MSDNDNQQDNGNDGMVEFSESHFDEPAINDTGDIQADATPKPTEETAQTSDDTTEQTTEETAEQPEGEDKPDEAAPEEKSDDVDLKAMSRAERAAYYQSLKQEQTREVAEVVNQNYAPQDIAQLQEYYMSQGADEFQALVLARQDFADQSAQIAEATTEIAELNANLRVDSFEAQSKYEWMNPNKADSYDKNLHELAAKIFSQGITTDPRTGQIIDARMTPMQAAEIVESIRNSGVSKAQLAAQKAAEAQLAAVAPPTSTAPPKSNESSDDRQASSLERALNNAG